MHKPITSRRELEAAYPEWCARYRAHVAAEERARLKAEYLAGLAGEALMIQAAARAHAMRRARVK